MTDDQTRQIETPAPSPEAQAPTAPPEAPAPPATFPQATPATPAAPAAALPPTTPVVPPAESNRARWIVGLGVAGVAIALTVGAILFLLRPATPEALKYIPGDAAVVLELRMDLPGDQLQKLGNLLAHFPGFADQATLPQKLDESFNRLVTSATNGAADYQADIKPWLNGPAFIGMGAPAGGTDPSAEPRDMLLSATTNGGVTCLEPFEGRTVRREPYRGLELVIGSGGSGGTDATNHELACVIDGRQALLGEPATVRRALDAKADGTGMDRSDAYGRARGALGGDRIATAFVLGAALRDLVPGDVEVGALPIPDLAGRIPDWTMVGVRAEDDALVIDTVAAPVPEPSPSASLLPLPGTHASVIAPLVPADTVVFLEDQGTGVSIQNLLARARTIPGVSVPLSMLDGMGGAGELVGWIQDAGVVVGFDGENPSFTVLLAAPDEATATDRLATIRSLLALAAFGGQGVGLETASVNGVEVTTVTLNDPGALVPPGSIPDGAEIPETGPVSFSIAARGSVVLLASGPDEIARILDVQAGQSLAEQPAFRLAGERGLAGSRTTVYVAAGTLVDTVVPLLPADLQADWATEYAPYLDPIQAIGFTTTGDAAATRTRVVFTVAP